MKYTALPLSLIAICLWATVSHAQAPTGIRLGDVVFDAQAMGLTEQDGRLLLPLESVGDLLKIPIDRTDPETVGLDIPQSTELTMQLGMLEQAIAPQTPKEAVDTWLKGIRTRNGALQYAVMTPEYRVATKKQFTAQFWVTGVSSPHLSDVIYLKTKDLGKNRREYTLKGRLIATKADFGWQKMVVTVSQDSFDNTWRVAKTAMEDPGALGMMVGITKLK